jgi:hypothetical protein
MLRPLVSVLAAAGVAAMSMSPVAHAAMHATKEFEAGTTRPHTIAFLPPHAQLLRRKAIKVEEEVEEGVVLSGHLANAVKGLFEKKGYVVRMLTPQEVNADSGLQELVLDADRRYSEMLTQVRTKLPRQIALHRYQAGDEMRALASRLGVDAIGFADLLMSTSGGPAFFTGGTQSILSVSVIDGGTATIEAYFVPPVFGRSMMVNADNLLSDPAAKVGEMAERTLDELPPAAPTARAKPENDKDVVSDVESLLKK